MVATLASEEAMSAPPPPKTGSRNALAPYFARVAPGTETNYGEMCDRMALIGKISKPCKACDGVGYVVLDAETLAAWQERLANADDDEGRARIRDQLSKASNCRKCAGTGYVEKRRRTRAFDDTFTTYRCGFCHGSGEAYDEDHGDTCPKCREFIQPGELTSGYRVPITVRPSPAANKYCGGGTPTGGADDPPVLFTPDLESHLAAYGELSRRLERLRNTHPQAAAILEAYEGANGDRFGSTEWGRGFAVWPLTKSGTKVIEAARTASELGHSHILSDIDLLASERNADQRALHPDRRRRAWLRAADVEARVLVNNAYEALAGVP